MNALTCNNGAVPYSGIRPAILSRLTEIKIAGHRIFRYTLLQHVNVGVDANEYGVGLSAYRMPQLASIPKTKRQAALQPTHNGSDKVGNERNSGQRVDGRFHNSEDAPVQIRLTRLSSLAGLKRLIPFSKKTQRGLIVRAGRDFAMEQVDLNAFPQFPLCGFCSDTGITFDKFNGYRVCGCAAGVNRAGAAEDAALANEARRKTSA